MMIKESNKRNKKYHDQPIHADTSTTLFKDYWICDKDYWIFNSNTNLPSRIMIWNLQSNEIRFKNHVTKLLDSNSWDNVATPTHL